MKQYYDKPLYRLLEDYIDSYPKNKIFLKEEIIDWFHNNYPKFSNGSISDHLVRCSTNDESRTHHSGHSNGKSDLLYKIETNMYEKYDCTKHSSPIYKNCKLRNHKNKSIEKKKIIQSSLVNNSFPNFKDNLKELSYGLKDYLEETVDIDKEFGGPSLHFHKRAIEECNANFLSLTHIEMIYAMLTSWGMHKMGDTKTKIINFNDFKKQIIENEYQLNELKNKNIKEIEINELSNFIINTFRFTESKSFLVSATKVLHHIIPNLISPIDKQYSIRFMIQSKDQFSKKSKGGKYSSLPYNNKKEVDYVSAFLSDMHDFIDRNNSVLKEYLNKGEFNTSLTKIFDNLVIVFIKVHRPKK